MRRTLARLTLLVFSGCYLVPISSAAICMNQKLKVANPCGFVVDPYGMKIPHARVTFGSGAEMVSATTDEKGFFQVDATGRDVYVRATGDGFNSVATTVHRLEISSRGCRKPLYVMLHVGEAGCTMFSTKKSDLPVAKRD